MALELLPNAIDLQQAEIDDHITKYGEWYRPQRVEFMRKFLADAEKTMEALRAALAQPEQEPWGYISHRSWKMPVFVEADNLEVSGLPFNNPDYTPVYKAPPQREWQGLTDEERKEIIRQQKDFWGPVGWELECVKAIEAKLKEKNT